MKGPSNIREADRELLGAYVSGLNSCIFCYGIHSDVAKRFGVPESTLTALLNEVDSAPIAENLKPIFRLARKMTEESYKITQKDFDPLFEAGWTESDITTAILVVTQFNLFNLIMNTLGIAAPTTKTKEAISPMLMKSYKLSRFFKWMIKPPLSRG